jgi:MoaA/NifB/PqqE/SkfB family radical SAM enzyme
MKSIDLILAEHLYIEATSHCNLHCPQCPRFDVDGYLDKYLNPSHLNFELFSKNFDLALVPNLKHVTFEGDYGDALMHPDINRFVEFFDSVPTVTIITNGSLRSNRWWKQLANHKHINLVFSIDGLSDTNHIYRINSNFDKIMENATAFISSGGVATWKFIAFKHNEHQVDQARQLSIDMGFKNFYVDYTNRSWFSGRTWPVKVNGIYRYNIEPCDIMKDRTTLNVSNAVGFLKKNPTNNESISCAWAKNKSFYINHKGHVLPCCMSSGLTWQDNIAARLWQRTVGDINTIDITKHSLNSVINSAFYTSKLHNSLTDNNMAHPVCMTMCSSNNVFKK